MRQIVPINNGWRFSRDFTEDYIHPGFNDADFEQINIPHMNQEIPYNYFDEKIYQFISCYRRKFFAGSDWSGKRVYIDFEGVMTYAAVYLNGKYIGEHKGGYTQFSFDLTRELVLGSDNVLVVMVDSTERADIPPFGFVIDYLTYGGIYREVSLRVVEQLHIANVFAKPKDVLETNKSLDVEVSIDNQSGISTDIGLRIELISKSSAVICSTVKNVSIKKEKQTVDIEMTGLQDIKLWDIDDPNLYTVAVYILNGSMPADEYRTRIGFRTVKLTTEGFLLNGCPLKIMGLNRHQAYPYAGYAMPWRAQMKDADILKYDLGLNAVRTSHYPQSRHFLDRCDEIGLLVLEEIPGWQHIGDDAWKDIACENIREMIMRDRNHPSIFLWGVRINESKDCHDLYVRTNNIAHELDDTRQTGGIRCIPNSELLEDVYTMNDFILGSGDPRALRPQQEVTGLGHNVPYIVTEYNGHMYPTKRFDQEERLNEHTLRHFKVQNAAKLDPAKCGAIGWCAFDYNTHYQFGSGDRICYHGVMDMFRLPKFASYAYKSQQDPSKAVVMEPVTYFARGERNIGGVAPLTICTNCDYVELYLAGKKMGAFYPAYDRLPGLTHPPVIIEKIDGEWGMDWFEGEFIGYVNGREVVRRKYLKDPLFSELRVSMDDMELRAGDMDVTRMVLEAVDAVGNIIPFIDTIVDVETEGPGNIVGPVRFALIGGARAAWIKTTGEEGVIKINVICNGINVQREIKVRG